VRDIIDYTYLRQYFLFHSLNSLFFYGECPQDKNLNIVVESDMQFKGFVLILGAAHIGRDLTSLTRKPSPNT
jgi:hypothetical protein